MELEPWIVILGEAPDTTIAAWAPEGTASPALALFSTRAKADAYAQKNCTGNSCVVQLQRAEMLQVFIDAYREAIALAVLDPDDSQVGQMFQLEEVLKAARKELRGNS